jgi:hypothetical protein
MSIQTFLVCVMIASGLVACFSRRGRTPIAVGWLASVLLWHISLGHYYLGRDFGFGGFARCELLPKYNLLFLSRTDQAILRREKRVLAEAVRSVRIGDGWIAGMAQLDGEPERFFYVEAASGILSERKVDGLEPVRVVYERSQAWGWWDIGFVAFAAAGVVIIWRRY